MNSNKIHAVSLRLVPGGYNTNKIKKMFKNSKSVQVERTEG